MIDIKKKIGIIGIRGLPALYGAYDRFTEQFLDFFLNRKDIFFYIGCDLNFKKKKYSKPNIKRLFVYRGDGLFILINYFILIIRMYYNGVRHFVFFGYGAAPFFSLLTFLNCKVICNPDGIEWRRPQGKIKKNYFRLCETLVSKINITRIFDSKVIQRYYSINLNADGKTLYYPSVFEKQTIKVKKEKQFERFYIIGRLLEENNTEIIVKAFSKLDKSKKLYIIGNINPYFTNKVLPHIKRSKNIFYLGPIYNVKKLFNLCLLFDFYIHGHSVGGTNPTLIEAVSLQKPTIAFNTFFNKEILGNNAIYFKNDDDLLEILKTNRHQKIANPLFKSEFTANFINNSYLKEILG